MFADNTKLYRHINIEYDKQTIQNDLQALSRWSDKWLIRFNATKCKRVHMGSTNLGKDYKLGDEVILHDTKEKDLEKVITEDFKSSQQCIAAATKAH